MSKDYNISKNLDYQSLEKVKQNISSINEFYRGSKSGINEFYKLKKNRDRERELERDFIFEMEKNGCVK